MTLSNAVRPANGLTYTFTPPSCAAPTAVATNTVTSTSANVTFTASASATSYTVTYTPAGGTATTVTPAPTASPVALTGLTPGTAYSVSIVSNCAGGQTSSAITTSFTTLSPPPANNDCAGAISLTSDETCVPVTGSTLGATQSLPGIVCDGFTGNADDDVWYSFVATNTQHTVRVQGNTSFDAVVDVRSGTCASSANIGCADATTGGGLETAVLPGLTIGATYYVRVYSYTGTAPSTAANGGFTICITNPANVPCAQVTNAAVTAASTTGQLTFTAATGATNYTLTLTPTAGGPTSTATLSGSPVNLTGLTPSTAYTVTITTNCSNGGVSTPVTVNFTTLAPPPAPANDECAGAISLSSSTTCTPTAGSTLGATASTAAGTCVGNADDDVWYSFVATNTSHTIRVVGATGFDAVVNLRSGACPGVNVGSCQDGSSDGGTETITATGLTVGATYYVRVFDYYAGSGSGDFTICITNPSSCTPPTAAGTNSVTQTSANVTFTASASATSYTVTYTPAGGTATTVTPAPTASPVALTGLTSGTAYSVSIVSNCAGGLTSSAITTSFTTLSPPPANDDCANATAIACGQTLTGTTVGATNTGEPTTACGGTNTPSASPSVFYSFTGTGDIVTVTTCGAGTTIDTELFVYSGSCGALTCVDGNDDFSGCSANSTASQVTFTSVAGTQYYFMVQRFSSTTATGAFSLSLTCTPPPTCAAPTGVAAGSITQTGASISFTPSATATSYTATATPATGSPVTVTGTASPLVLTGLSSGTAYSVTVTSTCAGGLTATSTPAVTFTTLFPQPSNDDCATATALTSSTTCVTTTGTTIGATASTAAGACAGTADDDVWYSFVATNTSHTITVVGNSSFDAVVNLRSGACPGTTVGSCQDNTGSGGTETITATGLTVGATYLVRVYSYSSTAPTTAASGGFTICITNPASCAAPTAASTNSVTQTSANVTFTASASATSYTVTYTPAGGTATTVSPNPTASPVALTGLTPGTAYTVSVVSNCAGGQTSAAATTSFTTQAAAPQDLTVSSAQNVQGTYNNVTITGTGVATLTGPLTVNGILTVQTGGTLAQNCQTINGGGSFVLQAGAELRICDVAGIAATGATGAVQVTGTRTFSNDANYVYNGTAPQAAGPGLPARVRNLTVSNTTGLSLSQALSVAEVVRLSSGNLTLNSNTLTLLSSATGTALVDNTGGVVNGTATVQRYIDPSLNNGLGYRHYASPVSSTTVADLATSGFSPVVNSSYNTSLTPLAVTPFPTVFSYEQARVATNPGTGLSDFDKGWVSPNSLGEAMTVGRGYTVNIAASALVDFVGSLNNGSISTGPLARGTQPDAGWHLVGNPYPSPLDWSTVSVPAGLNGALYVHQSLSQYGTNYRSYQNGIGGNPLVASSQGFFVRTSTAGASPILTLTNANRVTSFTQQVSFNRGTETRPLLQLAVRNAAGDGLDETYVYFEQGATARIDDRYDAYKLRNTSANLFTTAGSEELSINGLAPLTGAEVVVPLGLQVPQAGTYTLHVAELLNFGAGADVLLRDAQTGTMQSLSQRPSYTFTLGAASAGSRFSLVFRGTTALSSVSGLLASQVAVFPNPTHQSFQLTMPAAVGGKSVKATLLNSVGQVVSERTLPVGATGVQAQFEVQHLAQGVYILRLETANGPVTKRVTVE